MVGRARGNSVTFMPAAWQVRRARIAVEQWNAERPDRALPWEWMEEALLAWRAWKEQQTCNPQEAHEAWERYEEFERKLPLEIVNEIFPSV